MTVRYATVGGLGSSDEPPRAHRRRDRSAAKEASSDRGARGLLLLWTYLDESLLGLLAILVATTAYSLLVPAPEAEEKQHGATALANGSGKVTDGNAPPTEPRSGQARADPPVELVRRIQSGNFRSKWEVTTGAANSEFRAVSVTLDGIDSAELRCVKRGPRWIVAEAPCFVEHGLTRTAQLRFVAEAGGRWKLASLRLRERTPR